ncbi:hypothetical protein [Fusobacterium necrophorum]|uniref:hypothetical protein n=1 Tax=Fusobacterium necrophorum TaxID=859 RepID=UPI0007882B48|nr:hypothetical protein [Fusobacterium necrophorum]KYM42936.1 hypothetical protein A2U15_08415 [Fusobacterium necrophorum subsp. funduliforme]
MAKTKEQTIYFYRLLIKDNDSKISLKYVLEKYIESNTSKIINVKKNEKEIWLDDRCEINQDLLYIRYEVSNFGIRENIKDRVSKLRIGYLQENQYLEKFQCVVLKKVDDNSYDVAFQSVQYGIKFDKFFSYIKSFFEQVKEENSSILKDKELVFLTFYQVNFLDRLKEIKNFKKMTIDGKVTNSPEFTYAGINIGGNELELKTHHIDIVKTKFNQPYVIPVREMKKLLEDQLNKYDNVKIILEGEGEENQSLKLLSDEIQISMKIKVEKLEGNQINYSDLKNKMIGSFSNLENMKAIALVTKEK